MLTFAWICVCAAHTHPSVYVLATHRHMGVSMCSQRIDTCVCLCVRNAYTHMRMDFMVISLHFRHSISWVQHKIPQNAECKRRLGIDRYILDAMVEAKTPTFALHNYRAVKV